jgi:hypothetical protein
MTTFEHMTRAGAPHAYGCDRVETRLLDQVRVRRAPHELSIIELSIIDHVGRRQASNPESRR